MTRARDLSRLANSNVVSVNSGGFVGIGSTIPDSKLDVDGGLQVTGLSTISNVTVGNGTTELIVEGDARITGILTIGTSSVTLDGTNNQVNVGTGITIHHTNGIQVGENILHSSGLTINSSTIAGITSSISDTAVDVFVYDTSKDSDGGAWRKRTQHTSWYNETLNTATRGGRREFPAVAVIVAEANKVTIYDGDDPDLPMWMVFTWSGNVDNLLGYSNRAKSAITAVNGYLITCSDPDGIHIARFVHDDGIRYTHVNHVYTSDSIANRTNTAYRVINTTSLLVASTCNDIAATVLPNAPIDSATGLPVPTIAVATDGGVSVIKDDGTVVDLYRSSGNEFSHNVAFDDNNSLFFSWGTTNGQERHLAYYETIPSSDDTELTDNYYPSANLGASAFGLYGQGIIANNGRDFAGSDNKEYLVRLYHTKESATSNTSSIAGITTSYNTGWMHGNIKGAFLSDTDTTDLDGGNKITNGDAWSGAQSSTSSTPPTGWTGGNSAQWLTSTGGDGSYIRLVNAGSAQGGPNSYMYQSITTVAGRKYKISVTQYHHATFAVYFAASTTVGGSNLLFNSWTSSSGNTPRYEQGIFTATGTTTYIKLGINSATNDYSVGWDDVVVTEVDEDRSVNANGLHSFGTVTKTPVATGADLVAYSGWSSSNYLFQPYNSALDFTDTMMIMLWVKGWESSDDLLHRGPNQTRNSQTSFALYCDGGYDYRLILSSNGSTEQGYEIPLDGNLSGWQHLCFTLSGGIVRGFLNGDEKTLTDSIFTGGTIFSQSSAQNGLWIGRGPVSGYPVNAHIALLRLSASAPSPEQVKKIYEDEKILFQENAACTLYGSSDAVTALAYDDTTNLLHVGTSSGRSDFQGLRRINNTTTAVTTAISASNGLIAEQ